MKPGDLVKYKRGEFVSSKVERKSVGLILERLKDPRVPGSGRVIRVKWNSKHAKVLWHHATDLEVISESR